MKSLVAFGWAWKYNHYARLRLTPAIRNGRALQSSDAIRRLQ